MPPTPKGLNLVNVREFSTNKLFFTNELIQRGVENVELKYGCMLLRLCTWTTLTI
jgi:hypothetical protein